MSIILQKNKTSATVAAVGAFIFVAGAIGNLFAPETVFDLPVIMMLVGLLTGGASLLAASRPLEDGKIKMQILAGAGMMLQFASVAITQIKTGFFADKPFVYLLCGALGTVLVLAASFFLAKTKTEEVISLNRKSILSSFTNNAILIFLAIMVVVICIIQPRFMQVRVLLDILTQSSPRLVIALGIAFALLIGGTDLSAGRMVGLAAVVTTSMLQTAEYSNRFFPDLPQINIALPILAALFACVLFGALNGWLVAQFAMHPFIATLAVQVIVYGATSLYFDLPPNNSQPIGGVRPNFSFIGQKKFFTMTNEAGAITFPGISILIPIAALICFVVWFLMNKTTFGKNVYAIGGNKEAAVVSGVNVYATIILVFMLGASMYALGGVLESARTAGATNNYGLGYETDAIAACVVGGVSLNGGVGKVSGIVSGVLIFTVIQYGLQFIGVSPMWQQVIKGLIIAFAVAVDLTKYRKK